MSQPESEQVDLGMEVVTQKDHLTKRLPDEMSPCNPHSIRTSREFFCEDCNRRVTEDSDGTGEYGHAKDCDHSVWRSQQ